MIKPNKKCGQLNYPSTVVEDKVPTHMKTWHMSCQPDQKPCLSWEGCSVSDQTENMQQRSKAKQSTNRLSQTSNTSMESDHREVRVSCVQWRPSLRDHVFSSHARQPFAHSLTSQTTQRCRRCLPPQSDLAQASAGSLCSITHTVLGHQLHIQVIFN